MEFNRYNEICRQPYVFSRQDLEFTFDLIREKEPNLAFLIQNNLMQSPVEKPDGINISQELDYFEISMSSDNIGETIETLTDFNLALATEETDNARQIVRTRTLICSWLDLAKYYLTLSEEQIRTQPSEEKPPLIH